jgi:hypothetical protein
MITDEQMRAAAAAIADEARDNHGGVDVIRVGPAVSALTPFGQRYSVMTIIPERGGQDFIGHDVILVGAESDPLLATVYRIALIIALEEFFSCVQIFGSELALAKYCQKKWAGGRINRVVANILRKRGLN